MRVKMLQSLKNTGARFGEHRAADKLGIPIRSMGDGFTWLSKDMDRTRAMAVEQWGHCAEAMLGGGLDVIILDEFTYPLHYEWLPVAHVLDVVPHTKLGRAFRDALGRVNQIVASRADRVCLTVAGLSLELKALGALPILPWDQG